MDDRFTLIRRLSQPRHEKLWLAASLFATLASTGCISPRQPRPPFSAPPQGAQSVHLDGGVTDAIVQYPPPITPSKPDEHGGTSRAEDNVVNDLSVPPSTDISDAIPFDKQSEPSDTVASRGEKRPRASLSLSPPQNDSRHEQRRRPTTNTSSDALTSTSHSHQGPMTPDLRLVEDQSPNSSSKLADTDPPLDMPATPPFVLVADDQAPSPSSKMSSSKSTTPNSTTILSTPILPQTSKPMLASAPDSLHAAPSTPTFKGAQASRRFSATRKPSENVETTAATATDSAKESVTTIADGRVPSSLAFASPVPNDDDATGANVDAGPQRSETIDVSRPEEELATIDVTHQFPTEPMRLTIDGGQSVIDGESPERQAVSSEIRLTSHEDPIRPSAPTESGRSNQNVGPTAEKHEKQKSDVGKTPNPLPEPTRGIAAQFRPATPTSMSTMKMNATDPSLPPSVPKRVQMEAEISPAPTVIKGGENSIRIRRSYYCPSGG